MSPLSCRRSLWSDFPRPPVRESRTRVRAAIFPSGLEFPPRRLTISLAPTDLPKESARFDLAIPSAIVTATGQLPAPARKLLPHIECLGELSLDRSLHSAHSHLSGRGRCAVPKGSLSCRPTARPRQNSSRVLSAEPCIIGAT